MPFDNDLALAPFVAITAADRFPARLTLAESELAGLPAGTRDLITAVAAANPGKDAFMVSALLVINHDVHVSPYTVDLHLTTHGGTR
jgi:hypothetical protein